METPIIAIPTKDDADAFFRTLDEYQDTIDGQQDIIEEQEDTIDTLQNAVDRLQKHVILLLAMRNDNLRDILDAERRHIEAMSRVALLEAELAVTRSELEAVRRVPVLRIV